MNRKSSIKLVVTVLVLSTMIAGCANKSISAKASTNNVPGNNISYYFSNEGEKPDKALIKLINSANKNIDIAIYSLTKKDIADAIISAKNRNVTVRLMSDKTEAASKPQKEQLELIKKAGIPIKINTHNGLLHDKFTVVDGETVATGSFNYTVSATNSNDENIILIKDADVAQGYDNNFNDMWNDNSRFSDY